MCIRVVTCPSTLLKRCVLSIDACIQRDKYTLAPANESGLIIELMRHDFEVSSSEAASVGMVIKRSCAT